MKKDLISIKDISVDEAAGLFSSARELKKEPERFREALRAKTLALVFQKPSNRTRVSFEVGMYSLGGHALYLAPEEINLGVRESVRDVARTLSRYVDGIVLRTFSHKNVEELAQYASVPVVNGLSDFSHPCQALADLFTVQERLGSLRGKVLAYIGDGNNVCTSLLFLSAVTGVVMKVASPAGYEPDPSVVKAAGELAGAQGLLSVSGDPKQAVAGADAVYTDVWTSMGREQEADERKEIFAGFQVNSTLLGFAKKGALVMHCLPAHRGEEITEEVIEGPQSVVFDQAENRMHVQKAILLALLKR